LGEIPSEMQDLFHELSLLEKRLENQRVSIHIVKLELNENEEVIMDEKHEKEFVKDIELQRKHSGAFVFSDLNNSDENLFANPEKCEVNLK
jgi:chaperonin cofactor prefoldin